jgi:multiple sugar transport system permease protein
MSSASFRVRQVMATLLRYIVIALILGVVLFPIYWMVITSFKVRLELTSNPPTFFPNTFTLENYQKAFAFSGFPRYMLNSAVVVIAATLISLVLGSLAGYSLARFSFRGRFRENVSFWILSTRMIPPIVAIIPIFLLFRDLQLLNSYPGLIIVYIGTSLPFVIWMMSTFISEVPVDLEEAAMIDGDTRLTALWRIVLPLAAPGLAATAIFSIILLWNEFLYALILTTTSASITLPVGIAGLVSQYELLWGEMAAAGTVAVIPILIFALLVQRYLVRGLTLGAVK